MNAFVIDLPPDFNEVPDVERLVQKALRRWLAPTVTVRVDMPDNWSDLLPLVVARRVPSDGAIDAERLDVANINVTCLHSDRSKASELSRAVLSVLTYAARVQYGDDTGYLARCQEITARFPMSGGIPDDGPDLFRFTATYRVLARSRRL